MAELQEWSETPLPADAGACRPGTSTRACGEAERLAGLGLPRHQHDAPTRRTSAPPTSPTATWDPLWEVCADLQLPVHFHIGASITALDFYGKYFWPSQHEYLKPAIGGAMLFLNNARVVINSVFAGIFDRFTRTCKMVSVESGIGWVPFILETMDYEILENAPEQAAELSKQAVGVLPAQLVRDVLVRGEQRRPAGPHRQGRRGQRAVRDRLPAPDVPVPRPARDGRRKMATLRPETRRKVLGETAAALYRV